MEARIFNTIILAYLMLTTFGLIILIIPDVNNYITQLKSYIAYKVNYNYILFVIILSILFTIYGVLLAWFVGVLFVIWILLLTLYGFITLIIICVKEKICKMPTPNNYDEINQV